MNKYGKISIIIASLMYPLSALIGGYVEWSLKSQNSNNVDITESLAYLRPILLTGLTTFILLLLASIVTSIYALKKDTDKSFGKLGLLLIIILTLLSTGIAILNTKTDSAISNYKTNKIQNK